MIEITDKKNCCGCAMCASICPRVCISMEEDNEGFVYPIVDGSKCINCHLCDQVCPILNTHDVTLNYDKLWGYIVQHKNHTVLKESTAGGAFTAIAQYTIERKGIVFGVELQTDLYAHPSAAHHIYIDNEVDLEKLRNSKYIQSYLGREIIHRLKDYLEQGRYVCFSGTPCQIAGLKRYLDIQKLDQSRLILVDVVCRAVPSPMIFRKYIEYQEKKISGKVTKVRFRDKYYGYKFSTMNIEANGEHIGYHKGIESDPWLRAFFSGVCNRPSCYDCRFRNICRNSDFTIWDCFNVGRFSKELDNDKGATRVLVNSEKGQKVFTDIKSEFLSQRVPVTSIVYGTKEFMNSPIPSVNRQRFFEDANLMNGYELFEKYFPNTIRTRCERIFRMVCLRLGIYSIIKKIAVKILKKY